MEVRTQQAVEKVEEAEEVEEVEEVEIVGMGNVVHAAGKAVKGKGKAVEHQGGTTLEESAASVCFFLLRPTIEEVIQDLNLESG